MENILNVTSKSDDWRAKRLSNFSQDPFILDSIELASVEGFIQGTKFPQDDLRRYEAFGLTGKKAKKYGEYAERKYVWWKGELIPYGSNEHYNLIERAIRAKFKQNPEALRALLETNGLILTHDVGEPEPPNTSLPAEIFCRILTQIRKENLSPE